ncbi:MAG: T9SS type A sorting domain-containing protein, partial [Bacteroidota bacterium]
VSDAIGLDVVAHAEAEASAGVGVPNLIGVGAGADIGAEGHVTFKGYNHYQENQKEFEFGISGKVQGSAEAGIKIGFEDTPPLDEVKTMLQIDDLSSMRGISFSVVMNNTTNAIAAYKICLIRKSSDLEEKITYTITGPQALAEIGTLESEITSLNQSASAAASVNVGNSTFNRIIDKVFSFLFNVQGSNPNGASVTYTKELTPIQHSAAVNLGVSLGISVADAEIGGGGEFEEGTTMTVTEGKWIYGHHFPTTTFSGTIPDVPVDHQEVLQQIIDDIPLSLRVLIGIVNFFTGGGKNQNFYIGDQGSYIVIPEGAVPPGVDTISCTSWSWYGNKITDRLDNIHKELKEVYKNNRKSAEEIYGMNYGIGGFYQFEPYNSTMLDTCMLTIKYTQDELQGIDESSLAVYWEDKANHTWHHLGGVVDTVENKVTMPVTFLSLFTLAPSQPYGDIGLNPSVDSLFADSISTLTVLSDLIFNNDSSLVKDNELFTVSTSLGQILTTDKDSLTGGIQVAALSGRIQFAMRSSAIAGDAMIFAFSLKGSARGDSAVVFYDSIAPGYPLNLKGIAGNGCAYLKWNRNPEKDIAGYKIYFDSDASGFPYNGHASVFGLTSPIISGTDTNYTVYGLYNDSSYYFSIKAYDVAGNESAYSNEVFLNLRIPDTMYVGNTTIQLRDTTCFNATEYLYVPTQYNFFVVDSGGSVTLVAGHKISMKPGVKASKGGYLHAVIAIDNNYCTFPVGKELPIVQNGIDSYKWRAQSVNDDKNQLFHLYPNPTTSNFTIELSAEPSTSQVFVRIFNMMGAEIMNKRLIISQKTEFSLETQPPGIYMVSVMVEGKMEMVKVIKYQREDSANCRNQIRGHLRQSNWRVLQHWV